MLETIELYSATDHVFIRWIEYLVLKRENFDVQFKQINKIIQLILTNTITNRVKRKTIKQELILNGFIDVHSSLPLNDVNSNQVVNNKLTIISTLTSNAYELLLEHLSKNRLLKEMSNFPLWKSYTNIMSLYIQRNQISELHFTYFINQIIYFTKELRVDEISINNFKILYHIQDFFRILLLVIQVSFYVNSYFHI